VWHVLACLCVRSTACQEHRLKQSATAWIIMGASTNIKAACWSVDDPARNQWALCRPIGGGGVTRSHVYTFTLHGKQLVCRDLAAALRCGLTG
jgi:hypothetical protein